MNSKQSFLNAALDLFSKYGYSGVSVRDIAKVLGMRESAMYKHYDGKAAVLEAIILSAQEKLLEFQRGFSAENKSVKDVVSDLLAALFDFYTTDDFMNKFRKIMIISQYESAEAKARYQEMFLHKSLSYYQSVFERAAEQKGVKDCNAELLASELYAMLFMLMQQYDCETDKAKISHAKKLLQLHIQAFFEKHAFLGEL